MNGKKLLFLFLAMLCAGGCTTRYNVPTSDQIWGEERSMIRLERDVQAFCHDLVKNISPGSVYITWVDNLHPHAPMLSEAYVVSMFERSLIGRGFPVQTDKESAHYVLTLTLTPSEKSVLALAKMKRKDLLVATKEYNFINGSEKWNEALCSYRFRTKTVIKVGSKP